MKNNAIRYVRLSILATYTWNRTYARANVVGNDPGQLDTRSRLKKESLKTMTQVAVHLRVDVGALMRARRR